MNRTVLPCVLVALMLLMICHHIWGVSPTNNDDAAWILHGQQGHLQVVDNWAKYQGRVFAYVSGGLIYLGLLLKGTVLGNVLQVGSFAVCFVCFHGILAVYFNARLALLCAVVNLAMFAIRWEGSIVTNYPLFSWTLVSVFIASIYLGRCFAKHGKRRVLLASLALLYLSLNIHENMTLLFGMLATVAVVANYFPEWPDGFNIARMFSNRRFVQQFAGTFGVVVLYFVSYVAWRLVHPSQYDGNRLGSLSPMQVLPVLLSYSTTGTVLTDFVMPFRVSYFDALCVDNYTVEYKPTKYLVTSGNNLVALLSGCLAAIAAYSLSCGGANSKTGGAETYQRETRWIPILLVGLSIAFVPVLPVAVVGKYQDYFFIHNIRSYVFTPICHCGWSLLIAACCFRIERLSRPSTRAISATAFALCLGTVGYCTSLRNEAVVADMRRETCRWEIVDQLAKILPQLQRSVISVHAPRLQSGSWFIGVQGEYWSSYVLSRYHQELKFENASMSKTSIEQGAAYVDYMTSDDSWQTITFAALLTSEPVSNQVVATEIGVHRFGLDPSDRAQYQLNYRDLDRGWIAQRLSLMATSEADRNVAIVRNIRAVPESIHVSKYSEVRYLSIDTGIYAPLESPVRFSTNPQFGENGAKWLKSGWHPQELLGTWMSESSAKMSVQFDPMIQDSYVISVVVSTLTGLGFSDQSQTVRVKIGQRVAATNDFSKGDGHEVIEFEVNHGDLTPEGNLLLDIELDVLQNPAKLGLSTDTRDLGLLLEKLTITRKTN